MVYGIQPNAQETCITWLSTASSSDKLDFLKEALGFFNKSDELEKAFSLVVNAKKRLERKRKLFKVPNEEQVEKRAFLYAPKSDTLLEPAVLQSSAPLGAVALQSAGTSKVSELRSYRKPVFHGFYAEEIIALDIEFVTLNKQPADKKHSLMCGTISIVNYNGESIYEVHNLKLYFYTLYIINHDCS